MSRPAESRVRRELVLRATGQLSTSAIADYMPYKKAPTFGVSSSSEKLEKAVYSLVPGAIRRLLRVCDSVKSAYALILKAAVDVDPASTAATRAFFAR